MGIVSDTNGTFSARENVPLSYGSGNVWEWFGFLPPVGMTLEGVGMTGWLWIAAFAAMTGEGSRNDGERLCGPRGDVL